MNKECPIVRDLLPSYIDRLTSEESNQFIEAHFNDCQKCAKIHKEMTDGIAHNDAVVIPSDKIGLNLIQKIRRRIFTIVSTVMFTFLVIGAFLGFFGNALFQEGNPIPLIKGISTLETSNIDYVQFSESPIKHLSKSNINREEMIVTYMEDKGWSYLEQMGNSYIFTKDSETAYIETRQFTGRYFVWEIPMYKTTE